MRNFWVLLSVVAVVLLVMCDRACAGWEPVDVSSPKVTQVFDVRPPPHTEESDEHTHLNI